MRTWYCIHMVKVAFRFQILCRTRNFSAEFDPSDYFYNLCNFYYIYPKIPPYARVKVNKGQSRFESKHRTCNATRAQSHRTRNTSAVNRCAESIQLERIRITARLITKFGSFVNCDVIPKNTLYLNSHKISIARLRINLSSLEP